MSWDESLFRAINGFAGQSALIDRIGAQSLHIKSAVGSAGARYAAIGSELSDGERSCWRAPALAATIGLL